MLRILIASLIMFGMCISNTMVASADLAEIKASGVLRHLGVPYSNFVSGDGDGLDVDVLKLYASHMGVKYLHIPTAWENVIGDLSGKKFLVKGDNVEITGATDIKGDIIGNGLTILAWRNGIIDFSIPYFPSAVWVLAKADSDLNPIQPSGDPIKDVLLTKQLLSGRQILGIKDTCLDPAEYGIMDCRPAYKEGLQLNDLPAAIIKGEYEITLQDAPDALLVLAKNPGKIKVLGPITEPQLMAFGISKDSPQLLDSFNAFLKGLKEDGRLRQLIIKYYPHVFDHFPNW